MYEPKVKQKISAYFFPALILVNKDQFAKREIEGANKARDLHGKIDYSRY